MRHLFPLQERKFQPFVTGQRQQQFLRKTIFKKVLKKRARMGIPDLSDFDDFLQYLMATLRFEFTVKGYL